MQSYERYATIVEQKESLANQIDSIQSKIRIQKKKQRKIKEYFSNIDKKKEEIEVVAAQIESLQKKLPSSISDAENITLIRSIADNFKIKNLNLSPSNEVNNGFYITRLYSFTAKATYLQFLLLLEELADSERILNVSEISLNRISDKEKGRYEIIDIKATIESYRYNDAHKEERGIDKIEKSFNKKKPNKRRKPRRKKTKK